MSDLQLSRELGEKLHSIERAARLLEQQAAEIGRNLVAERRMFSIAESRTAVSLDLASDAKPNLTDSQRRICERIINVFETGSIVGKYGAISIYPDGPDRIRQITYGRTQTTEYGNLRELIEMYAEAGGTYSSALRSYLPKIGKRATPLTGDEDFKDLLRRAGSTDSVMRSTQDSFFDRRYFKPALSWAGSNGFERALSVLVIYDSFIHSGRIRSELRQRFPERVPAQGGSEAIWVKQYVDVRHEWLSNHSNPVVRPSRYRTRDLAREIAAGNWDLAVLPILANGVRVDDTQRSRTLEARTLEGELTTEADVDLTGEELEWSEFEPPAHILGARAESSEMPAQLANRILENPNIKLATVHVSGIADNATARQNIVDCAVGRASQRSDYGTAPGGSVELDTAMLRGVLALAETYKFHVSEFCGGSHSANSRHYRGVAADINVIDGEHVAGSHPKQAAFRSACQRNGATQVLGPGNPGHATHIHAAWP